MRVFFDYLSDVPQIKMESFAYFVAKINKAHPLYKIHGIHGEWKGNATRLKIECPTHGRMDQWRRPSHPTISALIECKGCSKCAGNYRKTTEDFVEASVSVHGNTYDYSKTIYVRDSDKVTVTCLSHGEFAQTGSQHLQGQGCSKCGHLGISNEPKSKKEFVRDAVAKYGDWFDYSLVTYQGNKSLVSIVCSLHGTFDKTPNQFMRQRNGCSKCAKMKKEKKGRQILELSKSFISRARSVHGDLYKYINCDYKDEYTPVKAICKVHGDFWITPLKHIHKKEGCPRCR